MVGTEPKVDLENAKGFAAAFVQEAQRPSTSSGSTVTTISHDKNLIDPFVSAVCILHSW